MTTNPPDSKHILAGIFLAITAAIIWSGNFIIAKAAKDAISPIALSFFRWGGASLLMLPIGWQHLRKDWPTIKKHPWHFFWVGLSGICLFNTCLYIAGHHTSAINLAVISTTSSPVFSFVLATIFLKEVIPPLRLIGLGICLSGILFLISKGNWETLVHFRFSQGDWWILGAAFSFAAYNIFVRKKPPGIAPIAYLFSAFWSGTLLLLPAFLFDQWQGSPIVWSPSLAGMLFYLAAGTSVGAFFCWNAALSRLGAARTAIFGNLIPVFSSIEAIVLLGEHIQPVQYIGMSIIFLGVIMGNLGFRAKKVG